MTSHRFYPQLEGFRGVCILLLLAAHCYVAGTGFVVESLGSLAVTLFFALSGFLITDILYREKESFGTIDIGRFYVRRAFRILPAFYCFLAATAALKLMGLVEDPWHGFVSSCLFLRNIVGRGPSLGHLWSLSLEEQFYLFWPLSMLILAPRRAWRLCVALIAVITVWRTVAMTFGLYDAQLGTFYERSDFRLDSILVGCALAMIHNGMPRAREQLARAVRPLPPALSLAAVVAWTTWVPVEHALFNTGQLLLIVPLLAHLIFHGSGVFSAPALRAAGKLSYSLYLWQQLFLIKGIPVPFPFPMSLAATFAAAWLCHRFVEQPCLAMRPGRAAEAPAAFTPRRASSR